MPDVEVSFDTILIKETSIRPGSNRRIARVLIRAEEGYCDVEAPT